MFACTDIRHMFIDRHTHMQPKYKQIDIRRHTIYVGMQPDMPFQIKRERKRIQANEHHCIELHDIDTVCVCVEAP